MHKMSNVTSQESINSNKKVRKCYFDKKSEAGAIRPQWWEFPLVIVEFKQNWQKYKLFEKN